MMCALSRPLMVAVVGYMLISGVTHNELAAWVIGAVTAGVYLVATRRYPALGGSCRIDATADPEVKRRDTSDAEPTSRGVRRD